MHVELVHGDRAALGLAALIGIYWTARILVDAIYFSSADWPKGKQFAIGHVRLAGLLCFLAASYLALFIWNVWVRTPSVA